MSVSVQAFSFEDTVAREQGTVGVRGRGKNGEESPKGSVRVYPIEPGIPGVNFRLGYDQLKTGFFSPRHHHNFEQFRFTIKGTMNVGKGVDIHEGELGYMPEATYYGPSVQVEDTTLLVMQWPGPSASYSPGAAEHMEAAERLVQKGGQFENGVYSMVSAQGRKINKDGSEAVWEEVTGLPINYADERLPSTVIMKAAGYRWIADKERPGLSVKHLGTFNEYRTSFAMWRLAPGTTLPSEVIGAPEIRFVVSGDAKHGDKVLGANGLVYLPEGARTEEFHSDEGAELLVVSIPMYVRSTWDALREEVAAQQAARVERSAERVEVPV